MFKRFNSITLFCLAAVAMALVPQGLQAAASANVRVSGIGYLTGRVKRASILATATTWNLRDAGTTAVVATGAVTGPVTDSDFGYSVWTADFSAFNTPGTYYLEIPSVGQSINFGIQPDEFNNSLTLQMMGFYGWRCGTAVSLSYGGNTYSHAACHVNDGYLDELGQPGVKRDGTHGWHDAGDYNKYTVNAGITVGCLLQAWEDFKPALAQLQLAFIPEHAGAIPDYLAEVKWELDWVLKMQYGAADGRVSDKLSSYAFDPFEMPQADASTRYFSQYGTSDTACFVAMLAKAYRAYLPYDSVFANKCLAAATVSYNYLVANPGDVQATNSNFSTGNYNNNDAEERMWAAVEMWESTGTAAYLTDAETRINAFGLKCETDWDWPNQKNLGIFTYARSARAGRNAALVTTVNNAIKAAADARVTGRNNSGYGRTLKGNYYWGSNGSVARSALTLNTANKLFPSANYLDTAVDQIVYLYGRNQYNRSQITGDGINPPMNPHHRPSGSDGITAPWPGYLVGGGQAATDWSDTQASYQTNEVAINWNGAMVYNLAMFYYVGTPTPTPTITATATPTTTATQTRTRTATPTASASSSATLSSTPSSTPSVTPSVTPSRTGTATGSVTPSGTASATPSTTATRTRTATPSSTGSATPTRSATPTLTSTASPSATPSITLTHTSTDTITPGNSPTQTVTLTDSETLTLSPTATPTASSSATPSASPTATSTLTPTPTSTASETPSITLTFSATDTITPGPSPTDSPTATASATATSSETPSITLTHSPTLSVTPTATRTVTPLGSFTSTVTPSASPTFTMTLSATDTPTPPAGFAKGVPILIPSGDPSVEQVVGVPQPQAGPLYQFSVFIRGGVADTLELKLYSRAYVLIGTYQATGSFGPGWNYPVSFAIPGLGNGIYFTRMRAGVHGKLGKVGKAGKFYVLR